MKPGKGAAVKKLHIFLVRISILVFCWIPLAHSHEISSEILPATELIKVLQSGGHIIYMRHGPTDHTQNDEDRHNLEDCSSQRNLSEEGREQVKQIGLAMSALQIPFGEVFSSPYCRCKDTARLAFGQFQVEPDLHFSISKDEQESKHLGERLYAMMMNSEAGLNNVVFVGHTSNLRDGLGVWPKPEGVVVVFQKQKNKLVYKGIIKPDEWPVR